MPPGGERKADRISTGELEKVALRYLNRYDASVHQLRRVLLRHVDRNAEQQQQPVARQRIEELLERYRASHLLDDTRYAQSMARGLRERGASSLRVRLKLRQRGIEEEVIDRALEESASAVGADADLVAARAYARRRRLASRYDLSDPVQRQKALAALARQGFSFGVASAALAPEDE